MKRPTFNRLATAFHRDSPREQRSWFKRHRNAVPASTTAAPPTKPRTAAPSWHELVKPGPKGDPKRRNERLIRAGERRGRMIVEHPLDQVPRWLRREAQARGRRAGRLVLHRSRFRAIDSSELAEHNVRTSIHPRHLRDESRSVAR